MKFTYLIPIAAFLLLFSCKKERQDTPKDVSTSETVYRVASILQTKPGWSPPSYTPILTRITYNKSAQPVRVVKNKLDQDSSLYSDAVIEYHNGKIKFQRYNALLGKPSSFSMEYIYGDQSERLTKVIIHTDLNTISRVNISYNNSGQVSQVVYQDDPVDARLFYEFGDGNNVAKITHVTNTTSKVLVQECLYDNQPQPVVYDGLSLLLYNWEDPEIFTGHNILRYKNGSNATIENVYEYNEQGYPLKIVKSDYTYEYTYIEMQP